MDAQSVKLLLVVVLLVYLTNWKYSLFSFPFDLLHVVLLETAIVVLNKDKLFGARTRAPVRAVAEAPAEEEADSAATEETHGREKKAEDEEKVVKVEKMQIDLENPARPTGAFPVHETYGPMARQMQEDFLQMVERDGDWEIKFENSDCRIFANKTSENMHKMLFDLNNTPLTCFDLLNNVTRRLEWDDMMQEARVLEEVDKNTVIYYLKSKPIFPTSSRDSVIFSFRTALPDGRLMNVLRSIDYPSCPPDPTGKVIRAVSGLAGMVCSPVEGSMRKTKVLQVSNIDPKGWIPAQVRNMVLTKAVPKSIANMSAKVKAEKSLDVKVVLVAQRAGESAGARGSAVGPAKSVDLAPLLARLREVEEVASTAAARKRGDVALVTRSQVLRQALEWAMPFMLGTIYMIIVYRMLRPTRRS